MKTKFTISFLYLLLVSFGFCNAQNGNHISKYNKLIDSLIKVNKFNDKVLLITFGADAITAINTKNGIVLVDAGVSTGLTTKYREIIENQFQSKKFSYLLNTHGHLDHCGGNSVFSGAKIVGNYNCINEINEQLKNPEMIISKLKKITDEYDSKMDKAELYSEEWYEYFTQKIRYLTALNDLENSSQIKLPDSTFKDTLNIDMGDITFNLLFFGKCHSESDILIYSPENKILFTGDLFSNYGRPSINENSTTDKEKWQKGATWIEKRLENIELIIGGHGQIFDKSDLKSFITSIREK
ncbi:MAG TPA: MBL fold metallo-hydrolase [Candidatus Kapabacteria bacterium]|nr:MBL fold metallo-hydrolase [Candidatus Kapabacteria bacterium]HPO62662.1 MBL fold metallo-hydrolase [Candidatus Kapabacteria bacterium]